MFNNFTKCLGIVCRRSEYNKKRMVKVSRILVENTSENKCCFGLIKEITRRDKIGNQRIGNSLGIASISGMEPDKWPRYIQRRAGGHPIYRGKRQFHMQERSKKKASQETHGAK